MSSLACDAPDGAVASRQDCDDADRTVTTGCRWTQVSAGATHTCGLHEDGSVECWGYMREDPPGTFLQVSSGYNYACGVLDDQTLSCWGDATKGEDVPPTGTFMQVTSALYHACGLATDGSIRCWGHDTGGTAVPTGTGFVSISVGWYAGCALDADGNVTGWYSASSLAGPYTSTDAIYDGCSAIDASGEIEDASDTTAGAAPAGPFSGYDVDVTNGCAIDSGGVATCWGTDSYGVTEPAEGPFTALSVGFHHACGLTADGFIECWGDDSGGACPVPE